MNNKEKKSAGGHENNKIVLLLVFMFLGIIFVVGIGADFLYKCNIIISICVPWMNAYEWVYGGALGLTLIKKYLFHSKCDIGEIWLKSLFFVSVIVIIIPASIFLLNKYLNTDKEVYVCGKVIETRHESSWEPSKTPGSKCYWLKIKLENEDFSFWYDYGKKPPLSTKCILSVKKGLFGLRYADNVDFLIE